MKEILPISNDFNFSVDFFRKQSTEFIKNRLEVICEYTLHLPFIADREKYVNDYKASMYVLDERNNNQKELVKWTEKKPTN